MDLRKLSARMQNWASKYFTTRVLAEAGMMLALATILGRIKVYTAAQGGSVTAGSMIPLLLIAMMRGPVVGVAAGLVYSVIDFMFDSQFYHPIQFILDYPLAFGALGLAGLFWKPVIQGRVKRIGKILLSAVGAVVGIGGRFLCHFLAGVWFFGEFAPEGTPAWLYSLGYQAGYLVPEIIISAAILSLLVPSLTVYLRRRF